jgi:hypothetical protein
LLYQLSYVGGSSAGKNSRKCVFCEFLSPEGQKCEIRKITEEMTLPFLAFERKLTRDIPPDANVGLIARRENLDRRFVFYPGRALDPSNVARGNDWGVFEIRQRWSNDRLSRR